MSMSMGLGRLGLPTTIIKRSNRWMLDIPNVAGTGINVLPPLRGGRPGLTFKEIEIEHISETVWMPTKVQWKPLKITVYDLASNLGDNPVFNWILTFYNAQNASFNFVANTNNTSNFKKTVRISLFSGDGCTLECWNLENAWPRDIEFSTQDMATAEVCTIDMELRYDRAYILNNACINPGTGSCSNGANPAASSIIF